jgi:hypothetical protein
MDCVRGASTPRHGLTDWEARRNETCRGETERRRGEERRKGKRREERKQKKTG